MSRLGYVDANRIIYVAIDWERASYFMYYDVDQVGIGTLASQQAIFLACLVSCFQIQ